MQRQPFRPMAPSSESGAARRGSAFETHWTVNQRLLNAERELSVQFTRIAQLQAQLDVVLGELRRSSHGVHG